MALADAESKFAAGKKVPAFRGCGSGVDGANGSCWTSDSGWGATAVWEIELGAGGCGFVQGVSVERFGRKGSEIRSGAIGG